MPSNDPSQWGVLCSLIVALLAVGRTLWKWEQTFTAAARDEIVLLRVRITELEAHVRRCEDDTVQLRDDNAELRRRIVLLEEGR